MEVVFFVLFLIVAFIGIVSHFFGLPGNFIILIDAVFFSWYGEFKVVPLQMVFVLTLLAFAGEAIEFLLGIIGGKKYRSSKLAIVVSMITGIIGAVWGAPFFFGIGSVIGAFVGAFVGAFMVEIFVGKNPICAIRSGWGIFIGRVGGVFIKVLIGFIMISIVIISYMSN